MQIEMEPLEGLERRLRLVVPAEEVDTRVQTRLREIAKTARFNGFRAGKAPPSLVAQRYGQRAREEALEDVLEEGYREGLRRHRLVPAGRPVFREEPGGDGTVICLSATFEVYPEVTVLSYEGVPLTRPRVTIDAQDLALVIERLRVQHAVWDPVERPAEKGDRVVLDFRVVDAAGRALAGGERRDYVLEVGAGALLPEIESGLVGMRAGEEADVTVRIPEEYFDNNLAGGTVSCHLHVKEVAARRLPEVDEAFVARFGMDDVDAWTSEVRASMEREAEAEVRRRLRAQVDEALLEHNPVPVPKALVEEELERRHHERLRALGVDEKTPMGEAFRESEAPTVRRGLALSFLYAALFERLALAPDPVRVERAIRAAVADAEDVDAAARRIREDASFLRRFEELALEEQLLDWIVEHAVVTEEEVPFRTFLDLAPSPSPAAEASAP
jgi:trigger factor